MTKQINQILNFLKGEFDLEETEDVAQNHQDVVLKRIQENQTPVDAFDMLKELEE